MTTQLTSRHPLNLALAPIASIEQYVQLVNTLPLLSAAEEQDYAMRLREHNDIQAAQQLVLSHLRFVVKIAKGFMGYGLALADLIQEGNIGLMKAVRRFDPSIGVRLVSFAVHWIKAEIHEFIIKNWRIVKIATTKAQRKLFFNLRSAKKRLGFMSREEISDIAKTLKVKEAEVVQMEARMDAYDMQFDAPVEEADDDAYAPVNFLASPEHDSPEYQVIEAAAKHGDEEKLQTALESLDERAYDIIASRWLADNKATLGELAEKYQVSAERIRQLETNAMKQLKHALVA